MNTMTLVWLVLFGIATLLFFGAAVVITVVGANDLRQLLSRSHRTEGPSEKGA